MSDSPCRASLPRSPVLVPVLSSSRLPRPPVLFPQLVVPVVARLVEVVVPVVAVVARLVELVVPVVARLVVPVVPVVARLVELVLPEVAPVPEPRLVVQAALEHLSEEVRPSQVERLRVELHRSQRADPARWAAPRQGWWTRQARRSPAEQLKVRPSQMRRRTSVKVVHPVQAAELPVGALVPAVEKVAVYPVER
jgi:hypothetical protein